MHAHLIVTWRREKIAKELNGKGYVVKEVIAEARGSQRRLNPFDMVADLLATTAPGAAG